MAVQSQARVPWSRSNRFGLLLVTSLVLVFAEGDSGERDSRKSCGLVPHWVDSCALPSTPNSSKVGAKRPAEIQSKMKPTRVSEARTRCFLGSSSETVHSELEVELQLLAVVQGAQPVPPSWRLSGTLLSNGSSSWEGVALVPGPSINSALNNSIALLSVNFTLLQQRGYLQRGVLALDALPQTSPIYRIIGFSLRDSLQVRVDFASLPQFLQHLDLSSARNISSLLSGSPSAGYFPMNSLPTNLTWLDLSGCKVSGVLDFVGFSNPVFGSGIFNFSGNNFSNSVDFTQLDLSQTVVEVDGSKLLTFIDLRYNPLLGHLFLQFSLNQVVFSSVADAQRGASTPVSILIDPLVTFLMNENASPYPFQTPQLVYCRAEGELVHMLRIDLLAQQVTAIGSVGSSRIQLRALNAETFQECNFTLAASLTFPVTGYIAQSTVFGTVLKGCVPDGVLYARQARSISPQIELVLGNGSTVKYGQCPQEVQLKDFGQYFSFSPNLTNTSLFTASWFFSDLDNHGGNVTARGFFAGLEARPEIDSSFLWPIFIGGVRGPNMFRFLNQELMIFHFNLTFPRVDDHLSPWPPWYPWNEILYSPNANGTRSTGAVYLRNAVGQIATYHQYWYGPVLPTRYYYSGDVTSFELVVDNRGANLTLTIHGNERIVNENPGWTKWCFARGVLQYLTPQATESSVEALRPLGYNDHVMEALRTCLPQVVNGTGVNTSNWTLGFYQLGSLNQFQSAGSLYFVNTGAGTEGGASIHFVPYVQTVLPPNITVCASVGFPYSPLGFMSISFAQSGVLTIVLYDVGTHYAARKVCTGNAVVWYVNTTGEVVLTRRSKTVFADCFPRGTETASLSGSFQTGSFDFRPGDTQLTLFDEQNVALTLSQGHCNTALAAGLGQCDWLSGFSSASVASTPGFLDELQPLKNGIWSLPSKAYSQLVNWMTGTAPSFHCIPYKEFTVNTSLYESRFAELCYANVRCAIDTTSCVDVALGIGNMAGCFLGKGYPLSMLALPILPSGWNGTGNNTNATCGQSDPPYAKQLLQNTLDMVRDYKLHLLVQCTSSNGSNAFLRACPAGSSEGDTYYDVSTFPVLATPAASASSNEVHLRLTCTVCTSYVGIAAFPLPFALIAISSAMSVIFILLGNALDPLVKPAIIAIRIKMSSVGLLLSGNERKFYEGRLRSLAWPDVLEGDFVLRHMETACDHFEQLYRERKKRIAQSPRTVETAPSRSAFSLVDTGVLQNPNFSQDPRNPALEPQTPVQELRVVTGVSSPSRGSSDDLRAGSLRTGTSTVSSDPTIVVASPPPDAVTGPRGDDCGFPEEKSEGERLFRVVLKSVLHTTCRLIPQSTLRAVDNGTDPVLNDILYLRDACDTAVVILRSRAELVRKSKKKKMRSAKDVDFSMNNSIASTNAGKGNGTPLLGTPLLGADNAAAGPEPKGSPQRKPGLLNVVDDCRNAALIQLDKVSIRTLQSAHMEAPISALTDSIRSTPDSFILIQDYIPWKFLVPKQWYINVQLLIAWIYFFSCLWRAFEDDEGVSGASDRYADVYFRFLNSSMPGSLLVNLVYLRLGLYQQNEQLLQDAFDMVRAMMTNRYFLCGIAVLLPPLFSHIIIGLVTYFPLLFGTILVLFLLRWLVSKLPTPTPGKFSDDHKMRIFVFHRFNFLLVCAHLLYRSVVTFCVVSLLQVGFNYGYLKIYQGKMSYFDVVTYDWDSRSAWCSYQQVVVGGVNFFQHILDSFLP